MPEWPKPAFHRMSANTCKRSVLELQKFRVNDSNQPESDTAALVMSFGFWPRVASGEALLFLMCQKLVMGKYHAQLG